MITIQKPGQAPLEIEYLLVDYEGTLAIDGRVHPKAKDKMNLLSKRIKIYILFKGEKDKAEERLKKLKAEMLFLKEEKASEEKLDFLRKLDPQKTVAIGNGLDDAQIFDEVGFSICIIGKEGACGETLKRANLVMTDILDALDFLLKPFRQKATLGR